MIITWITGILRNGVANKIHHEKVLYPVSSYSCNELDSDSRKFLDDNDERKSNGCIEVAKE